MSVEVLKSFSEIERARTEMIRRGLSHLERKVWWKTFAQKLGLRQNISIGDYVKSWDVLKTVCFIERQIPITSTVLDIGAYASEILCVLHRLGYSNLTGVDLNPRLLQMPYPKDIRYELSNFMRTPFADESFSVITAVSVIEHGFDGQALLDEIVRLLRPGGYFIASFDYWPEKIKTDGVLFFEMEWIIFSQAEVSAFIEHAACRGLTPVGPINLEGQERAIHCGGKDYTFAWMVLRKSAS